MSKIKQITKQEAIEAVKGIFNVLPFDKRENRKSFFFEKDGNVSFLIDKNEHERYEVIAKLQEYFADKNIEDGQKFYLKDTLITLLKLDREKLPDHFVGRDYNLFPDL